MVRRKARTKEGVCGSIALTPTALKDVTLVSIHDTDDGLVVSEVTRLAPGEWFAHHYGPLLDGGKPTRTLWGAVAYLAESFHQMFPEHECNERCRTGQMQ